MKLNKLARRSEKGSLVTFLLVLGIIGITLITGIISLELLIRWVSLGRIQHAAQEAAVTYAKSMHRLRHNQMSQHNVQAIDYTYSGLALPNTSTPISGALSSVKGATDLEYTQASQVLLSNIWGTRITDSSLVDDVSQNQCYKSQEESRFNKNPMSPRNNCEGTGKVSSPIMSLRWNFQSSAYGYGVCCPLGNNDSNKDFCVNVNVSGRMDPVMAGGLPFLHNIEFIKDGNFNINARVVVMKMAAGASSQSSEDITAEQIPSSSVTCPVNSPGIPKQNLTPAQVEALIKANCYHPEFGVIHDGVAILGNADQNCQPEKYAAKQPVPYCPPGSPGCPLGGSDTSANYPGSEAPRENPVCADTEFNEQYYLNKYPDIAALVKKGTISSGAEHFAKYGQAEGRECSPCASGGKCKVNPICLPGSPGCCLGSQTKHMTQSGPICCENTDKFDPATGKCIKRCIICVPGSPGCCLAGQNYFMTKGGPLCCPTGQSPGMVNGRPECKPTETCGPGMPGWNPQTQTCTPGACEPGMPGYFMTKGGPLCCPEGQTPGMVNGKAECKPPETCGPGMPGYDPQTKTCCGPGMPNYNPQTQTCTPSNCPPNEYMVPGVNPPKCCPTNMTIIDTSGQCKPCPNGMMPNPTNGKCEPAATGDCKEGMPGWNPQTKTCCGPGMPGYDEKTKTCTSPPASGGCPQGQSMNSGTKTCEPTCTSQGGGGCVYVIDRTTGANQKASAGTRQTYGFTEDHDIAKEISKKIGLDLGKQLPKGVWKSTPTSGMCAQTGVTTSSTVTGSMGVSQTIQGFNQTGPTQCAPPPGTTTYYCDGGSAPQTTEPQPIGSSCGESGQDSYAVNLIDMNIDNCTGGSSGMSKSQVCVVDINAPVTNGCAIGKATCSETQPDTCGKKVCGTYTKYSPISLVWSESSSFEQIKDLLKESFVSKFDLNPAFDGKWYQWKASAEMPLLVYNPKRLSKINSAEQLFGNYTFGKKWENGYQALATLDKNHDHKVSGIELKDLMLWFDADRDGISDDGELKTLNEAQVLSLFFNPDRKDGKDVHASLGYERMINGQKVKGASVDWFGEGPFNTKAEAISKKRFVAGLGFINIESVQ